MFPRMFPLALVCAVTPVILLGCSGGGSSFNPKPTATPTTTPTTTPTVTPTVGTANISFVTRNGAYFGTSPYSVADVTADVQGDNSIVIGFAPIISGSDARYFTLTIQPSGTIQSGQTFSLQSGGSSLIASAPVRQGAADYISYGGAGFTTGSVTVTRTGDVATFVLTDVVVRDNSTSTPSNRRLTFNADITVTLPSSI